MSSVLDRSELEQSPLADLHLLANELGVDGFRRLRRDDLIDAIVARQTGVDTGTDDDAEETDDAEDRKPRRGRRGGRGRRRADAPTLGAGQLEGTFDHGDEGYGLWLDPAVTDNAVYAEHWAGHRNVIVAIEEDQIVIRRAGEDDDNDD